MGTLTVGKLDNLYWLGRYLERVQQSIIMYNDTYDKLIDQSDNYYKAECEKMGMPDTFDSAEDFVWKIAFDTENQFSILSNLYRAYDNAMVMRDEITSEALSYVHLALAEMKHAKKSDAPIFELYKVKDYLLAFWGALDDLVSDEAVRNIVKAGKRIERLDIYLRREADSEELKREMNRLTSRIDYSTLPYNKAALMYAAAMIEDETTDYKATLEMVWKIIPPLF